MNPDKQAASQPGDDDTTPFDDDTTSRAVDDIVAHESDQLLEAQDEALAEAAAREPKRGFFGSIGHFLASGKGRWTIFLLFIAAVGTLAGLPVTRYWALNMANVRASASVAAVDDLTKTPLKNVRFSIGGKSAQTDATGRAVVRGLRLGPTHMTITQIGFAAVDQSVVVGWGSNPLGTFSLKATGVRYTLNMRDYLTGKPLAGVEARSGDAVAQSDQNGKLVLTLASAAAAVDPVTLQYGGYRTDQVTLKDPTQPMTVTMVVAKKTVYMSKESGKYDIYKADLDGQNKQLLVAATGSENSNNSLVMSPDNAYAALVSTRDNQRDAGGYLLSSLALITVADGSVTTITQGEQLQLIDWIGTRLIYEKVAANTTLTAYNTADGSRVQLAAAAHISVVFSAQGSIYYGVGADSADASAHPAFYKINPDGNGRATVLDTEIWSGQRVGYNTLDLQTAASGWYAFDVISNRGTAIDTATSYTNRLYVENAPGTKSLWVDTRGGQGVLVVRDVNANKESDKITQDGLTYPLHWISDDVVTYRVVIGNDVADYVLSLSGGPPHKIADVTNTYGFSQGQ